MSNRIVDTGLPPVEVAEETLSSLGNTEVTCGIVSKLENLSISSKKPTVLSLAQLSYYYCNEEQKRWYNNLTTCKVEVKDCCVDLMNIVRGIGAMKANGITVTKPIKCDTFFYGCCAEVCKFAAQYGHLHCLSIAHERGLPWDSDTCMYAAMSNSFDCLSYAVDNGCPLDKQTFYDAEKCEILDWILYYFRHGRPKELELLENIIKKYDSLYLKYFNEAVRRKDDFVYFGLTDDTMINIFQNPTNLLNALTSRINSMTERDRKILGEDLEDLLL